MDYAQILAAHLIIKESGGYLKTIDLKGNVASTIHEKQINLTDDDLLLAASPKIMGMLVGKK
jgi:hypothetical protein